VDRLQVATPRVPPGAGTSLLAGVVDRLVARVVASQGDVDLLLVADPRRTGVAALVEDTRSAYWCRDHFEAGGAGHARSAARERRHLGAYDLVTGVSPTVVASLADAAPDAVVVRNGCDAEHFGRTPSSTGDRRSTLGFLGGVGWRVDVPLLAAVARARPDWRLLIIGEAAPGVLADLPNVEQLGRVPYEAVPEALAPVDVGLVPYLDNAFNRASFPLKVFEYLAAGRPVVSSPVDALQGMDPFVRVVSGLDATVAAVAAALQGTPQDQDCRRLGAANSWTERASRLLELVGLAPGSPDVG